MNSYPENWAAFLELKARRGNRWRKLARAEYDAHPDRKARRIYLDEETRIYYLVDAHNNAGDGNPEIFYGVKCEHSATELDCYRHAGALGFLVPLHYRQAIKPFGACYEAVLALSEVAGPSISDIQKDPLFPETAKPAILREAIVQAIVLGLVYADRDRANAANIILGENGGLYHIDFEEAGKSGAEKLFRQLCANYAFDESMADWQNVTDRLTRLHAQLAEDQPEIHAAQRTIYRERISAGLDYINMNCRTA